MVSGARGLPVMLVVSSGDQSVQLGSVPPWPFKQAKRPEIKTPVHIS